MHIETVIEENAHRFLQELTAECNADKHALFIIEKYLKDGKITNEEEHVLKVQLFDSLRIVGIGIPFILIPGASVLIPILIRVAGKHNINLVPSAFRNQDCS